MGTCACVTHGCTPPPPPLAEPLSRQVLTWTKACGSAKAREFFTVATTESLVVVNGAAQHGWDASDASVPLQTVSSHTDKSTFFLSMQRHASVQPFAGLADIDEDAWSVRGGGGDTAAVAADSAALVQVGMLLVLCI